jgi:hypothetical protein
MQVFNKLRNESENTALHYMHEGNSAPMMIFGFIIYAKKMNTRRLKHYDAISKHQY